MTASWQPSCKWEVVQHRARLFKQIRQFFDVRGFTEVDTPLLSQYTVTDPHIQSFTTAFHAPGQNSNAHTLYLQTSPEYAMKRLLASGCGPIYQLGKVFRNGDYGHLHQPEFTLLEWYQPGFDHYQLMDQVDELLQTVGGFQPCSKMRYAELFHYYLNIDPHRCHMAELSQTASQYGLSQLFPATEAKRADWLDLLLSHCIEPHLAGTESLLIYDFPECHSALAKTRDEGDYTVAERFEAYVYGIELANGFNELNNASAQHQRFQADQKQRHQLGYPVPDIDPKLIKALEYGLPDSAGVALGVDRLLMLILGKRNLKEVVPFTAME